MELTFIKCVCGCVAGWLGRRVGQAARVEAVSGSAPMGHRLCRRHGHAALSLLWRGETAVPDAPQARTALRCGPRASGSRPSRPTPRGCRAWAWVARGGQRWARGFRQGLLHRPLPLAALGGRRGPSQGLCAGQPGPAHQAGGGGISSVGVRPKDLDSGLGAGVVGFDPPL